MGDKVSLAFALNKKSTLSGKINKLKDLISKINIYPKGSDIPEGREVDSYIDDLVKTTNELIALKIVINKANFESGVSELVLRKAEVSSLINSLKTSLNSSQRIYRSDDVQSQKDDVDVMMLVKPYEEHCEDIQNQINELNIKTQVVLPLV